MIVIKLYNKIDFMKFLFDLGGVFFNWDPNHFYKNVFEKQQFSRISTLKNGIRKVKKYTSVDPKYDCLVLHHWEGRKP